MRYSNPYIQFFNSNNVNINFNLLNLTRINIYINISNPNGAVNATVTLYDRQGAPLPSFVITKPAELIIEYANISRITITDPNNYQIPILESNRNY